MKQQFADVLLPLPLEALSYEVPEDFSVQVGQAVEVRLRNKLMSGIVLRTHNNPPPFKTKKIVGPSQALPHLKKNSLELLQWISAYYLYPAGEVLADLLPPHREQRIIKKYIFTNALSVEEKTLSDWQKRGGAKYRLWSLLKDPQESIPKELKGALQSFKKLGLIREIRESIAQEFLPVFPENKQKYPRPTLNEEQAQCLQKIRGALEKSSYQAFLLEGVTGSGKTEIYLHAAEHALSQGKSVLIVVPEIALTPQLFARFTGRLGNKIAVLHSGLTEKQRSDQWHAVNDGNVRVVIGARSAILAPLENIGLIVVDEEHEGAFKQEDRIRYNARDLALVRAQKSEAAVILGSATPSLESYYNAKSGKYTHLLLRNRATLQDLPQVKLINTLKSGMVSASISGFLLQALKENLEQKKQSMLLLNRRGYASYRSCNACGFVPECKNCSVTLTYYAQNKKLCCHYCGHSERSVNECEKCGGVDWRDGTLGTEALAEEVKKLLPEAKVLRIDRESMRARGSLEEALLSIANGGADIIIGTQMIAKGHDFPNVTLVGVVNADSSINIPDFRASEKSFQLFTQMAGRAGRGDFAGQVVLQSTNPTHPSIFYCSSHDYAGFAKTELEYRLQYKYPPFMRLARLMLSHPNNAVAEKEISLICRQAEKMINANVEILGPAPALLHKLQNRYRWSILLKSKSGSAINAALKTLLQHWQDKIHKDSLLQVDVDPSSLL